MKVIIASGVHIPLPEIGDFLGPDRKWLHAIVCKGTTFEPRTGNTPPRMTSRRRELANSIGLQNPGLLLQAEWIQLFKEKVPEVDCWLNLYSPDIKPSLPYVGKLPCAAIEVNLSCPNVQSADFSKTDLQSLRSEFPGKVFLKVPPQGFFDEKDPRQTLEQLDGLVDGFVLSNSLSTPVAAFTPRSFERPDFGVSGPKLLGLNTATIQKLRPLTKLQLIGCGGVAKDADVQAYARAGADAVQLGMACLWDPHLPVKLAKKWAEKSFS